MKKLFLIFLFLLIPSLACAGEVITTGQGATLEAAIHNAMRSAIEHEAGILVESKTWTQNYQTIIDDIMVKSSGFIEGYEILRQSQNNGVFEVEVKSNVNREQLQSNIMTALQKKNVVETNMNDPRIAVVAFDNQGVEYAEVENEIISGLKSQGFNRLIDINQLDAALRMRLQNAVNDSELRKSIENQYHIDYLVNVQVKIVQTPKKSMAILIPRMISVNTGEIIYGGSFNGNSRMFTNNSLESAIQSAAKRAAYAISNAALQNAARVEQHLTIVVTKETMSKFDYSLDSITNKIRNIQGVRNIFRRSVINDVAQLDLNFDGTASEIVTELSRNGFTIIEMASEYIKI